MGMGVGVLVGGGGVLVGGGGVLVGGIGVLVGVGPTGVLVAVAGTGVNVLVGRGEIWASAMYGPEAKAATMAAATTIPTRA
jgi:hypothetical protein